MKALPPFKGEDDERKFWATVDSTEYIDWASAKRKKLLNLKPTLRGGDIRSHREREV